MGMLWCLATNIKRSSVLKGWWYFETNPAPLLRAKPDLSWERIVIKNILTFCLAALSVCSLSAFSKDSTLKAVMQINSPNMGVVVRGLENALDVSEIAQAKGQQLDLRIVVFGQAVDLFEAPADESLRGPFQKLSKHGDVHFYVSDIGLKRIQKGVKKLLSGFTTVQSGAYEVLRLQGEGYLYIKP
jgi:intracellular sulfur oxidation DsrE/DsrF family protein